MKSSEKPQADIIAEIAKATDHKTGKLDQPAEPRDRDVKEEMLTNLKTVSARSEEEESREPHKDAMLNVTDHTEDVEGDDEALGDVFSAVATHPGRQASHRLVI